MHNRVVRWHTQRTANLLDRLSQINEPQGRLLDNTMIVDGSNLADDHEHAAENLPILVAGGQACGVDPGRIRSSQGDVSMYDLHLAILRWQGLRKEISADTQWPL